MLTDYHMHFEFGSYNEEWVKLFFKQADKMGLKEIGITEHTHAFKEFRDLYYNELILDDSEIGKFQKKWLEQKTKFCHTLDEYKNFINLLKSKDYPVKFGLEVCNFRNQKKVEELLSKYEWDYIIVSIHFIKGWGFDFSALKHHFNDRPLREVWIDYAKEIEIVAKTGIYDILGHPFNLRIFENIPEKQDVEDILENIAALLKEKNIVADINTGTYYRYPIKEITPYPDFMEKLRKYDIPIIISSDAHYPEHVGMYLKEAGEYAKSFGFDSIVLFDKKTRQFEKI